MKKKISHIFTVMIVLILLVSNMGTIRFYTLSVFQRASNDDIAKLNECYKPIVDCIKNNFDRNNAIKNIVLFKDVLDKGITISMYKKSEFYNETISFYTKGYEYTEDIELSAYHCRDMILAMYLASVMIVEPDNLANNLKYMLDGVWFDDKEFVGLVNNCLDLTQTELNIISEAFYSFADSLDNSTDKVYSLSDLRNIYENYNDKNPSSALSITELDERINNLVKKGDYHFGVWYGYSHDRIIGRNIHTENFEGIMAGIVFTCFRRK